MWIYCVREDEQTDREDRKDTQSWTRMDCLQSSNQKRVLRLSYRQLKVQQIKQNNQKRADRYWKRIIVDS